MEDQIKLICKKNPDDDSNGTKTHHDIFKKFSKNSMQTSNKMRVIINQANQSEENHKKECHQFWLRLCHAVILISNFRISASAKINWMAWT